MINNYNNNTNWSDDEVFVDSDYIDNNFPKNHKSHSDSDYMNNSCPQKHKSHSIIDYYDDNTNWDDDEVFIDNDCIINSFFEKHKLHSNSPEILNVLLFGSSQVGKSSFIKVLTKKLAINYRIKIGCNLEGTTLNYESYYVKINCYYYRFIDTCGFNEGSMGRVSFKDAINNLVDLLITLKTGICFAIHFMTGMISNIDEKNYNFLKKIIGDNVPICAYFNKVDVPKNWKPNIVKCALSEEEIKRIRRRNYYIKQIEIKKEKYNEKYNDIFIGNNNINSDSCDYELLDITIELFINGINHFTNNYQIYNETTKITNIFYPIIKFLVEIMKMKNVIIGNKENNEKIKELFKSYGISNQEAEEISLRICRKLNI